MPLGVRLQVYVDVLNQSFSITVVLRFADIVLLFDQDPLIPLRASCERKVGEAYVSTSISWPIAGLHGLIGPVEPLRRSLR